MGLQSTRNMKRSAPAVAIKSPYLEFGYPNDAGALDHLGSRSFYDEESKTNQYRAIQGMNMSKWLRPPTHTDEEKIISVATERAHELDLLTHKHHVKPKEARDQSMNWKI